MNVVRGVVRTLLLTSLVTTALLGQQVAPRYSPEVERAARALFTEVMSPYCPGLTLTSCPSEGAFLMKDSIRAELAAGRTPGQIMDRLEATHGPGIRARPAARGFGLVAYLGPFVAIALAGFALTWWVRRSVRRSPARVPRRAEAVVLDEASRERLARGLREGPDRRH